MSDQDQQAPAVEPTGGAPDHAASLYPDTPAPEPLEPETDDAAEPSTDPTDGADATPPADGGDVDDAPDAADELHQRHLAAVERIERAAATYENAANRYRNNPTPENQRAAEKAQSKLQQIAESEDLDLEPGAAIKTVASEIEGYQKQQGETQAQYNQRLAQLEQQNAYLMEQVARSQFEAHNPGVNYDDVVQKTRQRIDAYLDGVDEPMPPKFYERWVREQWQAVIDEAKAKPTEPAKPTPPAKPRATQPIKTNSGSRPSAHPDNERDVADILYPQKT